MVDSKQQFRAEHSCPVCGPASGKGTPLLWIPISRQGHAHCAREKHITQLERNATVGPLASRRSRTALYLVSRRDAPPFSQKRHPSGNPLGATRDGEVTKVGPPKYICITLSLALAHLVPQLLCLADHFLFCFEGRTNHHARSYQLHLQFNRVPNQLHAKSKRNLGASLAKGERCRVSPHNRL